MYKLDNNKIIPLSNGLTFIETDLVSGNYILQINKSKTESVNKKLVILK
jgi:hypothetical protein